MFNNRGDGAIPPPPSKARKGFPGAGFMKMPHGWDEVATALEVFLQKHNINSLFPKQYTLCLKKIWQEPYQCQNAISHAFAWRGNDMWFFLNIRWKLYCKFVLNGQYPECFSGAAKEEVVNFLDYNCGAESYHAARRKYKRWVGKKRY